jgi:hypothetical protein
MGVRWGLLSTAAINEVILQGARASDRVKIKIGRASCRERV